MYTDLHLNYSSNHLISGKESDVSSLFRRAYSTVTNKDDLTKETAGTQLNIRKAIL